VLAGGNCAGVVGLAKNCGKTTTLNALIQVAAERNIAVGITSGGRDGELYDAITGLPKPPIRVPRGALIALADFTIGRTSCRLEVVQRLGVHTTAGEIVIARALEPGNVEVIGCNRANDLIHAVSKLRKCGAELALVDGAAGRTFLASPDIVQTFVLATGAALDSDVQGIADATRMAVHLFTLPAPPPRIARRAEQAIESGVSAIMRADGRMDSLPWPTLLGREPLVAAMLSSGDLGLVCARAVGDGLLAALTSRFREHSARPEVFRVVAADPSRIAAGDRGVKAFEAAGGELAVLRKAGVAAITVNPSSPSGTMINPSDLVMEVSKHIEELPVFDMVAELSASGGVMLET
jgi:hypothetical protein